MRGRGRSRCRPFMDERTGREQMTDMSLLSGFHAKRDIAGIVTRWGDPVDQPQPGFLRVNDNPAPRQALAAGTFGTIGARTRTCRRHGHHRTIHGNCGERSLDEFWFKVLKREGNFVGLGCGMVYSKSHAAPALRSDGVRLYEKSCRFQPRLTDLDLIESTGNPAPG